MNERKQVRILIADDNPSARKGLIALLNALGSREEIGRDLEIVGEAANGLEAVALARELAPDLIFMDIKMPLMDGLKATEVIKQQSSNTVVVALSMQKDFQEIALKTGADEFIEKGSETQKLKRTLLHFSQNDKLSNQYTEGKGV